MFQVFLGLLVLVEVIKAVAFIILTKQELTIILVLTPIPQSRKLAFVRINGVDLIQGQGIPATITAKVTSISGTTVNVDSGGFTNGISVTGPEKKIPTIQDTDTFLVQRGSSFYKSNKASLMDKIQDDDYLLVARGSTQL